MKELTIAIDGYSSCGKSSTSRLVAKKLGYRYIDSGAMYRAVTLYFLKGGVQVQNTNQVKLALDEIAIRFIVDEEGNSEISLNGIAVEKEIRNFEVASKVSEISAIKEVREALVDWQRKMGDGGGIVMDGRDIGTVVFPYAELKYFMTADCQIRAKRRFDELKSKGDEVSFEEILENIRKRDSEDTGRAVSPLFPHQDARIIDTTFLTLEGQVDLIYNDVQAYHIQAV